MLKPTVGMFVRCQKRSRVFIKRFNLTGQGARAWNLANSSHRNANYLSFLIACKSTLLFGSSLVDDRSVAECPRKGYDINILRSRPDDTQIIARKLNERRPLNACLYSRDNDGNVLRWVRVQRCLVRSHEFILFFFFFISLLPTYLMHACTYIREQFRRDIENEF